MASVTGIINVKVNTAGAVASLAGLGKAMQAQNAAMLKGSAAVGAGQLAAARAMQGRLNQSGKWVATTGSMMTATGRMAEQFDKGTHKSFSNFRRGLRASNMDMAANTAVNRLAQQRVRALQTQYMGLGREVDGVQKVMKMTPASMLTDNFGRSAEYANQRAVLFRRNLTMGANSMVNWGKNTQWAGRQMMVGLGIPLGIAAVGAVRSFKDIEQASISFRRVYGDSVKDTAQANGVLKTVMSDVGQEYTKYGVAMSDTIAVAARAAATGQKGADLVGTTRETLRLATLGQLDYDQALESTIATQTAFGVSTNGLTRVTDFLNAAENQTILSMSDMTKAIPRVAPVIRGLGGDVEDLGVLMTALRAGGVTAEQGANALKSGLASLINPTSSATAAMKDFGIPLDKIVNTNKGDLIGTVQDFGKALQELPKFEQQQALESLFGKYQYARMGALFRNINKKQAQTTADLSRSSNEKLASFSSQEMDQIADSALNKFQGAVERLKAAAAPLGEAVLKVLAPVIDFGASALTFLTDNSWAAWAAGGVAALTGLIGVGTMLTGVFANFFGTMIKGGQMMHRAGAWSRSLLTGKRNLHGGMGLEGYSSIAELEASSAQKALSAAANAASASFMKEAEAVAVLVAELQRMNAAAAQSVATTTAAGKRPPGSGAVGVPAQTPPSTPPSSGGAVGLPALAPPRTAKQGTVSSFQAGHIGGLTTMTPAQIRTMREAQNAPTAKNFNKSAPVPFSPYRKETAWWADEQARKMAADSSYAPKAYTGQNILMSSGLNAELNNQKTQGGFGSAGKGLWLESLRETGAASMTNPLRMMGIRSNNPMAAQYATGLFDSFARQVAAHPGEYIDEKTAGRYLDHAAGQTFANDPKLMAQYEKLKLANAVDTKSIPGVASGGRRGVAEALPGAGLLPSYAGANKTSLVNWGGVGDMPIGAETLGVIDGALGSLAGAAGSATGALEGLAGAAAGAAGKSQAATTAARAAIPDGLTPSQRTQNLAGRMANTTFSDPALEQRRQAVLAQREQRLAAQQAAQQQENRAKSDAARASQYARGYAAQQAELEKSQKAATSAAAKSNSPSLWNRMRAGGVFSGGTRGMTPEEKLAYDEKKQGRMAGMSNKLFGLGMAVDVVTMGLTMTGHELPGFAHVIGPATMALGMFPGAISAPISALAALGPVLGTVVGAIAAIPAVFIGAKLLWEKSLNDATQSGEELASAMLSTSGSISQVGEVFGKSSIVDATTAKEAGVTVEALAKGNDFVNSLVGQQMQADWATALSDGQTVETAGEAMAAKMSSWILSGVMDKTDAKGVLAALGESNPMQSSAIERELMPMLQNYKKDPVGLANSVLDKQLQVGNTLAQGLQKQMETVLSRDTTGAESNIEAGGPRSTSSARGFGTTPTPDSESYNLRDMAEGITQKTDFAQTAAKNSGLIATIWSDTLSTAFRNRAAAEAQLAQIKEQAQQAEDGSKEERQLTQAYENGTKSLADYNKKLDETANNSLKAFDSMKNLPEGVGEDAQKRALDSLRTNIGKQYGTMGELASGTARDMIWESNDPELAKLTSGEKIQMEARIDFAMSTGAVSPDTIMGLFSQGLDAKQIDIPIKMTGLREGGDFLSRISKFNPDRLANASKGIGNGFVAAAKGANMTKKEAIALSTALGGSKRTLDLINKAYDRGNKGQPKAMKQKVDRMLGKDGTTKKPKALKQVINRSIGKDGSIKKPKMLRQLINRILGKDGSKKNPKALRQLINRLLGNRQDEMTPEQKRQLIDRLLNLREDEAVTPQQLKQIIDRILGQRDDNNPAVDVPQTVNRTIGSDASQNPPPSVTQIVNRVVQNSGLGAFGIGGSTGGAVRLAGGGPSDLEPLSRAKFLGRVTGKGGPREDAIPAWLSNGEYVVQAKAVKKYGNGFLNKVNSGSIDPKSVLHLKDGSGNDNSKKKGSDDSGGKDDKDTGWKDWTKEVKKLSKSWDKASKLAVKMKVSNPLLASLFGTGSPNAIGKFNPKKSKEIKQQFKKKQLMESLQATFDTLSENEKMAKAAKARVKLLKKHKGLAEDINRLEADELLAIKKSKNSKAVLKKVMKARNAASDAMFAQEWQSFADESTQSQALNAKRVELANSQKNPEYKKLMLQLTDEEVKQYNATKPGKREQFLIRRRKAMLAQEAFEKEVAKEERLSDLRGQKDFSNRFSNKEFQSLAIESPAAAAGMTEEDYEILQSLSGNELEKFRKALIEAADAANKTSRATELLNKKAEYAAMTLGQQFQEGTELLNQKSQAMRDEQAAIGEQKIVEATGKTRNQLEAEIGTRGVEVSRFQHQQELEQRHMDDINEKYNEQAKLLDDISQAQQIISSLQRGRLSVASALSSGDIAAAAAAAQEQRASEAQASIDMMKSALEKERDDRLKEHQDRIDEAQDSIDTLNDQIFEYQHAMDSIAATYALIGADTSVNIDKLNTSLQAQSGYWAAVTEDIDEYINALKEVNPNVLKLPEPSQTTPTTPSAPGGDNNNNNNNNNNNTTPPPLTPKQTKAVKIADRVEKKAMKAMDKAQDAKKAAKKTKTKKDDRQAKKATNKAEKIEGLADKADKVALTGNVGKAKELNQNAKQKLENVNNKVGSVNVVASKADSKVADKKVDNLQDKLKAAKEDDDRKKAKALAAKLEKAKEDAKKAENAKQQAQAAAAAKKKADDDENRKKQSQEAEKQRKKKEEDNKKAQAQNKNKKNNGGFITKKYAGGGFVGGVGNTDKVPALLTPGEFVMTKGSAARYGKALEKVNSPSYKFASSAAGYSGGSAMGTSIYNLTVNAQTNADANDIATITIKRIQDMERTRIRERKV